MHFHPTITGLVRGFLLCRIYLGKVRKHPLRNVGFACIAIIFIVSSLCHKLWEMKVGTKIWPADNKPIGKVYTEAFKRKKNVRDPNKFAVKKMAFQIPTKWKWCALFEIYLANFDFVVYKTFSGNKQCLLRNLICSDNNLNPCSRQLQSQGKMKINLLCHRQVVLVVTWYLSWSWVSSATSDPVKQKHSFYNYTFSFWKRNERKYSSCDI